MDLDIEEKIREGQKGGWRIGEVGWDSRQGREGFEYIPNWILTLSTGCRTDLGRNCNNEGFQQGWFQVCRRTGFTVCMGDGLRGAGKIDC